MDHATEPQRERPCHGPFSGEETLDGGPVAGEVPPAVIADLGPYDVDRLLRTYLEPPCFAGAVRRLAESHLLVLTGAESTGKRLGAIALLSRMSLADGGIVVLSPAATVAEPASRTEFEPGRAYLLHDWIGGGDDRYDLIKLAGELAEVGCFLVMTRNGAPTAAVEVEQSWEPPAPDELFDLCVAAFGGTAHRSRHELAEARAYAATLPSPARVVALAGQVVRLDTPMASPGDA
ncbi:hypothetical protein [Nonomuraea sp. LPB2021202275-12-8]|uniref:hypothetical protein n=1 Tax=Nonomuraea sp. LPB2021202275-12-8 TaxID=3120159 RepID=UPI00300C783C